MRSTSIGWPFKTSCGHDIDSLRLAIQVRHRAGETDMKRQPDLRIVRRIPPRALEPRELAQQRLNLALAREA